MKLTEWLEQFKTELDVIGALEEKPTNTLLKDMLYIHNQLSLAQACTGIFSSASYLSHLSNAKNTSDKYFLNNELKVSPTDEISLHVLRAYRNFAMAFEKIDAADKPTKLPGAPNYAMRVASIDKFFSKLENAEAQEAEVAPGHRMTR